MNISVKLFSVIKDLVGQQEVCVTLPERADVSVLMDVLAKEYPAVTQWLPYVRVAVNKEYVTQERNILENDEIAIIPPVSGG